MSQEPLGSPSILSTVRLAATMALDTREEVNPATTVARVATTLPYHEEVEERIILGILALFDKLQSLESLAPDPVNGPLFNQLFDLVTTSKTTTTQEERVGGFPSGREPFLFLVPV